MTVHHGGREQRDRAARTGGRVVATLALLAAAGSTAAVERPAVAQTAETEHAGEISLTAEAPEHEPAPWRGSQFTYDNEVNLNGLDRNADLTWNPYWAMTFSFEPRWWFGDIFNIRARLDLSREITQADDRTYIGETWVHDLLLIPGAYKFYTIPVVGIDLSADLLLTTPTSKLSQARTLALGLGPGVSVGRTFDLGAGGMLRLAYHVRFTSFLDRYTTSETLAPRIPTCAQSGSGCDEFLNTGERNTQWRVQHGVDVAWVPVDWFSLSAGFEHIVSWLYAGSSGDADVTLETVPNTDRRYSTAFYAEATFDPYPPIEIGLGYTTISPQLAPDSSYYDPFYNRYSTMYLDVRLEIEGLIDELTPQGGAASAEPGSLLARGL